MPKHILVTGGTGFIGSALVRALVERGELVRTFDNDSRGSSKNISDLKSVEVVRGDIRERVEVQKACRGMDVVCHLAAINGTENFYNRPGLVLEVGVKGIVNVLDAVKEENVGELFVMSTSEVYQSARIPTDETAPLIVPDPKNPRYSYGASKIISEILALHTSSARRTCIVRPHNVYGPCMGFEHVIPQFIERLMAHSDQSGIAAFPIQGTGDETRAFCFIDDFVKGFLCVLDRGESGEIYHIGIEEETSVHELAELIARLLGKTIRVTPTPLSQGSTPRRCPNIEKIRRLGFRPTTSLETGLNQTIPWYRKYFGRRHDEIQLAASR
jgi:nucleoside-diphosphate-sugar epimerase